LTFICRAFVADHASRQLMYISRLNHNWQLRQSIH